MLYREVPKNGDKLSVLGYGCMRLPVRMQSINEKLAEKQILYALDQGVNYFDTAVPYHNGKSEPFLGKVISKNGYREKMKIATKLPHWSAQSKADMDRILDEQLSKLKTDRIDYYLIHALSGELWETAKRNGVIEFMDDALKKGKIINAGFSFHGLAEEFKGIVDDYYWTFCQIQYNYLDTQNQAGTAGLQYAASKDLAVIIMEPLQGGNLAKTPPPSVQDIWAKADDKKTPVAWSLEWIWNHPEVTVILSGMNNDDHINENLALAEKALPNAFSEKNTQIEQVLGERNQVLKQLNQELAEAADYVRSILPQPLTEGGIQTDWRYLPSTSLGGDAFGYHMVDADHFAIYLIDVSGHGVGAALLSVSVMNVLRSQSLPGTDFKDPEQVLASLNKAFPGEENNDMFFTIWYGVYNKSNRELTYASGGHPPALFFEKAPSGDSNATLLRTANKAIGAMPGETYKKSKHLVGDQNTLYIFSDGVYEVEKSDGSMWQFNEFAEFMNKIKSGSQSRLDRLYRHAGNIGNQDNFEDDFTIVEVAFG